MHRTRLWALSALVLSLFHTEGGVATTATWSGTLTNNWNNNGNWTYTTGSTFPNAVDDSATMGAAISTPTTVTLGQNITVGTLTFSNANKYTIADATNTLTMQTSSGSALLLNTIASTQEISSALTVASPLTLNGNSTRIINLSGVVSSIGSQTISISSLKSTFSGNNTFTGDIHFSAGSPQLNISSDANLGNASNGVILNSTPPMATLNVSGSFSTGRTFTVQAGGSSFVIQGGTVTFNGPFVTQDIGGDFSFGGGGAYTLTNANSGLIGGVIVDSASVALSGSGNLSSSSQVFVNGTFDISQISASSTTINDLTGTPGPSVINLGSKILIINEVSDLTWAGGTFTGTGGSITKTGTANLTLTGDSSGNTFDTTISTGTLTLGGGNLSSAGTTTNNATLALTSSGNIGNLAGNGTATLSTNQLTLNGSGTATYSGSFTGSGTPALVKAGSGTQTLSGNGASLTGSTDVNAGTLSVLSTFPGAFNVNSGGTLKGTGSLGATTVNSGGTLQPGTSIGTMTVSSATFGANSNFQVEISPSASSLLAVGGSVSIDPTATVSVTSDPGTYGPMTYTILTTAAPPISGTFNSTVTGLPVGSVGTLFYDPSGAFIQLLLNGAPPTPSPTPNPTTTTVPLATLVAEGIIPQNSNVAAVALYLASLNPPPGSDLAFVISVLESFTDPDFPGLLNALDQLHEAPFAAFTLSIENMTQRVRAAITNRMEFVQKRCLCMHTPFCKLDQVKDLVDQTEKKKGYAPIAVEKRCPDCTIGKLSLWGDLIGDFEHQKRLGQNVGYYAPTGAGVLGLDYEAARNVYVGISGAYNLSYLKWGRHRANGTIQSYYASLYASWAPCHFFLNASLMGALNYNRATRHIEFIHRNASSRHTSKEIAGHLSAGVPLYVGSWSFTPYAAFDYMHLWHNPFREWGANSVDLVIRSKDADYLRSEAGLTINTCIARPKIKTVPSLKIAGVRDQRWGGRHFTASMAGQSLTFNVTGLHANHTLINPGAALTLLLNQDRTAVSFNYDGQFGHKYWNNTGSLEIAHSF